MSKRLGPKKVRIHHGFWQMTKIEPEVGDDQVVSARLLGNEELGTGHDMSTCLRLRPLKTMRMAVASLANEASVPSLATFLSK